MNTKTTAQLVPGDQIKVGDPVYGPWETHTVLTAPVRSGADFDVEYDQPIYSFDTEDKLIGTQRTIGGAHSKLWELAGTDAVPHVRSTSQEQADLRTERAERVRLGAHG